MIAVSFSAPPPGEPDTGRPIPLPPPGAPPASEGPPWHSPYAVRSPPPPGSAGGASAARNPSGTLAGIAIGLAVIGIIPPAAVAALVLGIVALVEIVRGRARGTGLAVAAIAISLVWMGATAALVRSGAWDRLVTAASSAQQRDGIRASDGTISSPSQVDTEQLREGDCFVDAGLAALARGETSQSVSVHAVPCPQAHDFEVYAVVTVTGAGYPGDAAIERQAQDACGARFAGFVGVPFDRSVLDVFFYTPTRATWSRLDDHSITCSISDGTLRTGTLRNARR